MNMKFARWLFASLLALAVLTGCGDRQPETKQIAIATLMSHPALDQVIVGLKGQLRVEGFREGENITITVKNANGEVNLIPSILQDIKARRPDVVVAITTPVAQSFARDRFAPLVFSAVTDPVGAGVVTTMDKPTEGISGVSDAWPYLEQLQLAKELMPEAKTLGVLYNPGEAASQYGIAQIRVIADELGLELVEMVATKTTEVLHAVQQGIDKVDMIYLSSDNTVIQALPAALKVALEYKKPLIVGDSGTVEKGGLAAVSVGYAGVGRETGKIVAEFLRGNTRVKPVIAQGEEVYLNARTAERIGLTLPDDLLRRAKQVYR